jgi:glycosyltransferase involved in cell wall biosynthesis
VGIEIVAVCNMFQTPQITVCITTLRKQPRFKECADSLFNALKPQMEWELLVVDGILWYEKNRREELADAVAGRFPYRHIEPKPSLWQGPHRLTSNDRWDACGARNTGFIAAKYPYVVFLDDSMEVDIGWFFQILKAYQQNLTHAGTYVSLDSNREPVKGGEDHRKIQCPDEQIVFGGWLYGMNMSVPLNAALAVDGYDEVYSGAGGVEDNDFGVRLHRYGCKTLWLPDSIVYQLMDHHEPVCGLAGGDSKTVGFKELVKPKERKLKNGMVRFANEFLTEKLLTEDTERYLPLKKRNIAELRKLYWEGKPLPIPTWPKFDWRDGQSLKDM